MQKRLTAIKTNIVSIVNGEFVKQEGFNPNYVITPDGIRLSRVRVMANIVQKYVAPSGKMSSLTLDDGTETIRAKAFKNVSVVDGVEIGDLVDIIGKIRMYNDELFIVIENIFKVTDPNMEILRMVELLKKPETDKPGVKDNSVTREDVLNIITELDNGNGVEYDDIIKELDNEKEVEKIINEILEDGTCFEPRPGRIKKL